MTALEDLKAAKAAVAAEQDAFDAAAVGKPPVVSERAQGLLRLGGIERVIDDGGCPDCAQALVADRLARAERNRLAQVLAGAKLAAGYDKAVDAAQEALRAKPEDDDLRAELGGLAEGI